MSYHIYTTRGLMLSERPYREADRVYSILTEDLGLIRASATGVRKEVSKLRGSLEPFQLSLVSLVRGEEYWRITSAQSLEKLPNSKSLARPIALLEKLVQGESPHPELFQVVEKWVRNVSEDEMFEINFVALVLHHLGYLRETDLKLEKRELVKAINEGLHQSHLD